MADSGTITGPALLFLLGYHGAVSTVGEGTALLAMLSPLSLHPVAQPAPLLPDIQFHNSFNRSKLWLLTARFCPYSPLSPSPKLWYLSNFVWPLFEELRQLQELTGFYRVGFVLVNVLFGRISCSIS